MDPSTKGLRTASKHDLASDNVKHPQPGLVHPTHEHDGAGSTGGVSAVNAFTWPVTSRVDVEAWILSDKPRGLANGPLHKCGMITTRCRSLFCLFGGSLYTLIT